MSEINWYDLTKKLLNESPEQDWQDIVTRATEIYAQMFPEGRSSAEVSGILRGLVRRMEGAPPPWLAIVGPDGEIDTPDDIWIEPAYNELEIENLWDLHDGRNLGTMVVAVYRWDPGAMQWSRDTNYGILGDPRKKRKADPDDPSDHLCSG